MIPETISHYRIVSSLGKGGMGDVYLAEDTRLDRRVAIKFLPAESVADERAKARLIREAKAAAKLDHPNVCAIYEVGQEAEWNFIVMQYVEGETLASRIARGPIELIQVVDIARQAADALTEAHAHQIIHRDIKPQNIMITARGQVKVLDFGLAKSVKDTPPSQGDAATAKSLTNEGAIAGTVAYMSPEQLRGDPLDGRSDIFSLGAVIYEMVSGHSPFASGSAATTISAILNREPPMLARYIRDVPEALEWIVTKALRKDREERHQTAKELLGDLTNLKRKLESQTNLEHISGQGAFQPPPPPQPAAPPTDLMTKLFMVRRLIWTVIVPILAILYIFVRPALRERFAPDRPLSAIDSIAVLPFVNVSGEPDTEYLSDGMSDTLIGNLSQLSNLRVISLSSVLKYKGQQVDPQTVGRELNVRALVTGRFIQRRDRVSVSTELVDIRDNRRLWGEQYDRKSSDILQLPNQISRQIVANLKLEPSRQERSQMGKRYTEDGEAYKLYLQGRFYWNKYTEAGFRKSIEYFTQATEKDPGYALAYAGMADAYAQLGFDFDSKESIPKSREFATKALELDDSLAEAHVSVAAVKLMYDWNFAAAEKELKRAIELNPSYPDARHFYGHYLEIAKRSKEAIQVTRQGVDLDPNSLIINSELALAYYLDHQYNEAIKQSLKTIDLDPNFPVSHVYLGMAYGKNRRYEDAIRELKKGLELDPTESQTLVELGYVYAVSGRKGEAENMIRQLKQKVSQSAADSYVLAPIYAGLGDRDQAFAWLEKAYAERSFWLIFLNVDPNLDSLRSDPRFADLVRRVGLPS
jgi:eukaryotic-like serine/threonine-protein kinase